jgi:hypothetical protein
VLERIWRSILDQVDQSEVLGGRAKQADLIASAELVAAELRAQIDHQLKAASEFDTKALGLLSVLGVAATLIAPRLAIDPGHAGEIVAAIVGVGAAGWSAFQGVMVLAIGRGRFSAGADATVLVATVDEHGHAQVLRGMLIALRDAIGRNEAAIEHKYDRFVGQVAALIASFALVPILVVLGAIE